MDPDPKAIANLRRALSRWSEGLLQVGERMDPVRFVPDPATGEPVMPVHADVLMQDNLTLFIPEDTSDSLQLLGAPVEIDPARHAACDRHVAFFGRPNLTRWMLLDLESVRRDDIVLDAAEITRGNPLAPFEPALCRGLNARPDLLAAACRAALGTAPAAPVAVGVDPFGVTVRARFGVMRLDFSDEVLSPADAHREIDEMLRKVAP
ncbi:hypothetical protein PHYC_00984 [Phycisphaerales bacterium]|nr:hypothetical protein PHYC_00984 [Phycisphaerales bacterium]